MRVNATTAVAMAVWAMMMSACGGDSSANLAPPAQTPTPTSTPTATPANSTPTPSASPTSTAERTATSAATATATSVLTPTPSATASRTPSEAEAACRALAGTSIGGARIRTAVLVAATVREPELCRITARIDTSLNFEVRLPSLWNHKAVFIGGGGYNGTIPTPDGFNFSPDITRNGYATIATDSGHQGGPFDASWALGNPEAVDNFAYLANHTVLLAARQIIEARYDMQPARVYFEGSSTGGREALIMAQRWPDDCDGIIAREPVHNFVALQLAIMRVARQMFAAPGGFVPLAGVQALSRAVLQACDAADGIEDGIVSNVPACTFDAAVLRCPGPPAGECLTDEQINTVHTVHSDLQLSFALADGSLGHPRWPVGTEDSPTAWPLWVTGTGSGQPTSLQFRLADQFIKYFVTEDERFDSLGFVPDAYADKLLQLSRLLDATDPDLSAFRARNGKVILWHGWGDYGPSAYSTAEYYDAVVSTAGGQTAADELVRFYTSPGVDHLGGGPGAPIFDLVSALDMWVEDGTPPGDLVAYKLDPDTNERLPFRPLCRYPRYPRYSGAGDAGSASSFVCTAP